RLSRRRGPARWNVRRHDVRTLGRGQGPLHRQRAVHARGAGCPGACPGPGPGGDRSLIRDPQRMTPEEFRTIGHRLIDWIADYRAKVAERPVMARTAPGEVRARLPALPPQRPDGFEAVFRDLEEVILPGLTHWQHPSFFGFFPA